ncbi:MAG: hypothetical protein JO083_11145 [Candidatus Eremiobacteraeota bacterium]|nr:hypothetical protein [Candidatus Eremiobacteraeota bacterium]
MAKRKVRVYVSCACYDFPKDRQSGSTVTETGTDPANGDEIDVEVTWQSSNDAGAGDKFKKAVKDNYDVIIVSSHANWGKAFDIESGCKEHSEDFPIDDGFEGLATGDGDKKRIEGAPKAFVVLSCNSAVVYGLFWPFRRDPVTERIKKYMRDTNVVGSHNPMPFCGQADVKGIIETLRRGTKPGDLNWKDHVKPHESEPEKD